MSVSSIQPGTGPRALTEPTVVAFDAATSIFNLPDYRVISATVLADGRRQIIIETDQPPGCPSCGVVATRRKERRFQRIRDIPVAGAVEVLWSKYRWHCEERACPRLSFFESPAQVPRRAVPPDGSGSTSLTRSSVPAGPCPRLLLRSRCPGGWSVPR